MSLEDVIDSLSSDEDVVVTRRAVGTMTDGIWVPGTPSTLILPFCSIQPATGMARVVGGRDMRSDEFGQRVDDVRVIYTNILLRTREASAEPDQVTFDGDQWVVVRDETWTMNDETIFRYLIVREVRGGA